MTLAWIMSAILFSIANTISPGPNNTLLTTTGANHGFVRALPHVAGTGVGIGLIFLALAIFGGEVLEHETFRNILKWTGIAYLAWLAWKIGSSKPLISGDHSDTSARPLTFTKAVMFQAVNPKVWLGGVGGILAYGAPSNGWSALAMGLAFSILFATISMPSAAVWAAIGKTIGHFLNSEKKLRLFNIAMALLLLVSLVPLFFI